MSEKRKERETREQSMTFIKNSQACPGLNPITGVLLICRRNRTFGQSALGSRTYPDNPQAQLVMTCAAPAEAGF